jgi:hypothetical protein
MANKVSFSSDAARRISKVVRDTEHAPVNRRCGLSSRHRSSGGSGGDGSLLTFDTKAEADAWAGGATPGAICYCTDLDRYYHLLSDGTLQAWSFLE